MVNVIDDLNRPSGAVLPLLLRKKMKQEAAAGGKQSDSINTQLEQHPRRLAGRVFTVQELEERIWRANVAMVDIQKQIHRGEETYYEETYSHGNLFRGWDAFVDAKDVGNSASSSSAAPPSVGAGGGGGSRRMPADFRWFSTSCGSVSRNSRPNPSLARLVTTVAPPPPPPVVPLPVTAPTVPKSSQAGPRPPQTIPRKTLTAANTPAQQQTRPSAAAVAPQPTNPTIPTNTNTASSQQGTHSASSPTAATTTPAIPRKARSGETTEPAKQMNEDKLATANTESIEGEPGTAKRTEGPVDTSSARLPKRKRK